MPQTDVFSVPIGDPLVNPKLVLNSSKSLFLVNNGTKYFIPDYKIVKLCQFNVGSII